MRRQQPRVELGRLHLADARLQLLRRAQARSSSTDTTAEDTPPLSNIRSIVSIATDIPRRVVATGNR